jgi:hypothetical protein
LGRITVRETVWRRGRGMTLRPFREHSAVSARGCSRAWRRAAVDFAADEAFAAAAQKLREHYGIEVPVSRVREVCLRQARAVPPPPAHVPILAARGPAAIVTAADGTMIPVVQFPAAEPTADRRRQRQVGWQEMRLVAAQAQGEVRTHYAAGFATPAEVGVRWTHVVRQAGWASATFIHGVGDGAEWIAEQFRQHFDAHGRYTLDLYHVCDYLGAAAPAPAQAAEFVATAREHLRLNRSAEVIADLATRLEPATTPEEQAPVRRAHRYLAHRREQLDYQSALTRQLPLGSGLIESGHRHLLQARLKLSGAWWLPDNAHAMAQLRVCRSNGLWDSLWRN